MTSLHHNQILAAQDHLNTYPSICSILYTVAILLTAQDTPPINFDQAAHLLQ